MRPSTSLLRARDSSLNACSQRDAGLEVVAAGDIGRDDALRAAAGAGDRRRQHRGRAVAEVGRGLEDRAVVAGDAFLREVDPVGHLPRGAGFDQQLVGERRCPRALDDTGRPPVPAAFRFDGVGAGERAGRAAARLLDVAENGELVLFGRLPRRAQRVVAEPVEAGRRPVEVAARRRWSACRGCPICPAACCSRRRAG